MSESNLCCAKNNVLDRNTSEAEGFEVIADVVKSLRRANRFLDSQPDWYQKLYASSSIPRALSHDTLQAKEDANAVERASVMMDALRPAQEISRDVSFWISEQATACEVQISNLKLRSGLLSLPDEILSDVLAFASYHQDKNEQTAVKNTLDAATKLSLVCSRFRTLINSVCDLWNRLSPSMRTGTISSCLTRCGSAGIQIITSTSSSPVNFLPFVRRIASETHQWRRFVFNCKDLSPGSDHIINLGTLRFRTLDIRVPLLSKLEIRYPYTALKDIIRNGVYRDPLHFYSTWSLPALRSMKTANLVPVSFSGTSSLASLSLSLNFMYHKKDRGGPFDAMALATFLSSCQALEDFSLTIRKCRRFVAPSHGERVVMVGVGRVEFILFHCNNTVIKSFLDVVSFPDVHRMRLDCDSREIDANSGMQCQKILDIVLPNSNAFPKLVDLELEICAEGAYDLEAKTFAPNRPASIPFSSVPNLCALSLTTWATLLKPLPEGICLPKLNTLAITNCWMMELDWGLAMLRLCAENDFAESPARISVSDCLCEDVVNQSLQNNINDAWGPGGSRNVNAREIQFRDTGYVLALT